MNTKSREELIHLAKQVQNCRDGGIPFDDLVSDFQASVDYPDVRDFFSTDYYPELIVDLCLGHRSTKRVLQREELLKVVNRILNAEGTEAENILLGQLFNFNCKHSAGTDLIYYPAMYFNGNMEPSAEQIIEKAMSSD